MLWLLQTRRASGLFNLGTGKARSFRELMQAVGLALGRQVEYEFRDMPASIRPNYQYFTEARMEKLRQTGFTDPFTSLEDGVADYVSRYLMQEDIYR
jgi:ADP-L-glycero-D-manno-heptose 6-epimerase